MKKTLLLLILFLTNLSHAQEPSSPLTLQQVWEKMLAHNLNLQQLDKTLQQMQLEMDIQKTGFLPTLATSASYNHISETARLTLPFQIPGNPTPEIEAGVKNQYDLALVLQQQIFTGFRTRNLVKSAKSRYQATHLQKQALQNQLLFQAGKLYYSLQLNLRQQQVLTKSIQRLGWQLQRVRNFFQQEQATAFDTLEVANRRFRLQNQLQKLKSLHAILLSKLRFLMNVKSKPAVQMVSTEKIDLNIASLDHYQKIASEHRPELRQLAALQKAQEFRARATKSTMLPQVLANLSYHYAKPGVNFFKNEWMTYYTLGVNLQWHVWTWRRDQMKAEQAKLDIQRLDLQLQNLMREIQEQVEEAYQNLITTRKQILLQQQLFAQEEERYRITNAKYTQGVATLLDLRSAENSLTEADLLRQKNYIEWYQHQLQLKLATGEIGNKKN